MSNPPTSEQAYLHTPGTHPLETTRRSLHLVKCDLLGLEAHVYILEVSAIHIVSLLFNGGSELEQLIGDRLVRRFQNVDQPPWS
jgi:hypothetical protein